MTDPSTGSIGFSRPQPTQVPAPKPTLPSTISYEVKANGKIAMKFMDADVEAEKVDSRMKAPVDKLLKDFEANKLAEDQAYADLDATSGIAVEPEKNAIRDIIDDKRMLADMKSEALFYGDLIWLTMNLGIGALGYTTSYVAKVLSQTQGFPQARLAAVLAVATGAVANGYVKVLEGKKTSLQAEIAELQQHIDERFN